MKNHGLIKLGASIIDSAAVVGKKEYEGPIGNFFDLHDPTDAFGKNTWEKSESEMQRLALSTALGKCKLSEKDLDAIFAGDLLNQCIGSSYGLMDFDVPYFGLYGACSTAAESLMLSAMCVSGGHYRRCAAVTSSHYLAAERQYRSPIEYGAQRSPTAQWTVTGAAAFAVERGEGKARITEAMPGMVVEKGINDASNMGAAMAPAAADTLLAYFKESRLSPSDFDAIVTGDLGFEGGRVLCELLAAEGLDIHEQYNDCGVLIYDRIRQDKHAGGSGCGCSAVVLSAYYLKLFACQKIKNMLFLGTGAMMSPSSIQQGLAIPAVAHLIRLQA